MTSTSLIRTGISRLTSGNDSVQRVGHMYCNYATILPVAVVAVVMPVAALRAGPKAIPEV
jgi:hypothetical protein